MVGIAVDTERCTKCGTCLSLYDGYCMSDVDGYPVIDTEICNLCQKCVAVCPSLAITVNGARAEQITDGTPVVSPEQLERFLERRRTTKRFGDRPIERSVLARIAGAATYAPNQNKNIDLRIVDDQRFLRLLDECAMRWARRLYRVLFGFRPLTRFFGLFSSGLPQIRKKMERDLYREKRILKEGTQAVIILTGRRRVPVTQESAHYLAATIMLMAESLGVGTCLMDSLARVLGSNRGLRRTLGIRADVLVVMALGYSAEGVVNIPRGYEVRVAWNDGGV